MKKHIYKTMAAMLLLSLISAPLTPVSRAYAVENEFQLHKDTGFRFDGTDWIYLGALGQKMTGWVTGTDGNKYYLDPVTGKLHTGWLKAEGNWYFLNTVSDGTKGKLMTGWQWIDGYCYYFDTTGKMLFGTSTPDGYYVNATGQWAEHDGTVHFISGKGFDTVHVLGATRTIPVTSRIVTGSSGGSGGSGGSGDSGGSGSSGRTENRDSGKDEKKETKSNTEKDPEDSPKDNKNKGNKPETRPETKPETKPEIKDQPDKKPEDSKETTPETKPGDDIKKDPETKPDKKSDVKVKGFKAVKPLKIPYQGDSDSTIAFIKKKLKNSGVTFYLSNGKRTTAVVTDWKIDGTVETGNTLIAKPEALKIPDRYKDIKAQFEKPEIEEKIIIVKGKAQEEETTAPAETAESQTETPTEAPTEAPTEEETTEAPGEEETTAAPENQHPDNWAITGYIEPDKLELEYIDNDINSYKQYFPKTVTFLTNDGTKITIDAKWNGYDRPPAAGREIKVNCQNGYEDLPGDIRYILMDSFETVGTPKLVIKFKAEESNKKEPDISLDRAPFEKATYDKYRYRLQESMTIEFLNYTGDGTDVVIKGRGFEKTLSELSYDSETKKVTVIVKDLVPNGYYGNNFYLNVTIGKKTIWKQIYVDTD